MYPATLNSLFFCLLINELSNVLLKPNFNNAADVLYVFPPVDQVPSLHPTRSPRAARRVLIQRRSLLLWLTGWRW